MHNDKKDLPQDWDGALCALLCSSMKEARYMLFGKSIRQRTGNKQNGYVRENRPSKALLARFEQSVERRDGHRHVNKGCARVDMPENGNVNWKERRRSTVARALAPQ
jgi:hypothetical protein